MNGTYIPFLSPLYLSFYILTLCYRLASSARHIFHEFLQILNLRPSIEKFELELLLGHIIRRRSTNPRRLSTIPSGTLPIAMCDYFNRHGSARPRHCVFPGDAVIREGAAANKIGTGHSVFITDELDFPAADIEGEDSNSVAILVRNNEVLPTRVELVVAWGLSPGVEVADGAQLALGETLFIDSENSDGLMTSVGNNDEAS